MRIACGVAGGWCACHAANVANLCGGGGVGGGDEGGGGGGGQGGSGRVVRWVASSAAAGWRDALTVAVMSHIAS